MSKFASGRFSGTRGSFDDGFRKIRGFTTKIHEGRQGKHIIGHNNYQKGKSVLRMTMAKAQQLIDTHGGTGSWIGGTNRERVDFGFEIGTYVSHDGRRQPTTVGNIHYSNSGAHIVPARPKEIEK